MAPWGWRIPVPEHWGEIMTDDEKEEYLDYHKDVCPDSYSKGKEPSFEEAYEESGDIYEEETGLCFKKDDNGQWRHWIKYEENPDGFWVGWGIEWSRNEGEVNPSEDLRQEFLIMDGQWLAVEGDITEHIKDLPDDVELVSINFRWA